MIQTYTPSAEFASNCRCQVHTKSICSAVKSSQFCFSSVSVFR